MRTWADGVIDPTSEGFECGYAGCAIDWMPKLVPGNTLMRAGFVQPQTRIRNEDGSSTIRGIIAVAYYFNISVAEAEHLFLPSSYYEFTNYGNEPVIPKVVSERMLEFLDSRGIPRDEVTP